MVCLILIFHCFIGVMNGLSTEYIDSEARRLGAKRLRLQLPWEQNQWELAFTARRKSLIPAPDWVEFPTQMFDQATAVARPVRLDRFNMKTHLSEVSWVAAEDRKHNLALQCWKVIVLDSTSHTALGRTLMHCIEVGKSEDYVWQVIADAFSQKASSTLRSRAASLLAFGRWRKASFIGELNSVFPISETLAYEYLCDLRRLHAAPSKGKRFLESIGFAKGLVGAEVDAILSSARVRGAAMGAATTPPKKRAPFTLLQLTILERMAFYGTGPESIFAGYICFLVHCRLRWSDGQHCIREPLLDVTDGRGFLEAALYHHKTSKKRRTQIVRLLPVAGVVPGLSGLNWSEQWLHNRKEAGLEASMANPTMPAPVADGSWSKPPLTASEGSVWLREILHSSSPSLTDIATHSAKTTILSWMSKANVEISVRRLAGYHVNPGDKSALEYSRDAAAPILRTIEAILIALRAGIFRPDLPRSQRWHGAQNLEDAVKLASKLGADPGEEAQHESHDSGNFHELPQFQDDLHFSSDGEFQLVGTAPCSRDVETAHGSGPHAEGLNSADKCWDDDTTLEELKHYRSANSCYAPVPFGMHDSDVSDISSATSSDDDDCDSSDLERQAVIDGEKNSKDLVAPSDISGKVCFRHLRSRKLHLVEKTVDEIKIFRCGRRCNSNYELLSVVPAFTAHGCMTCFGWSNRRDSDSSD